MFPLQFQNTSIYIIKHIIKNKTLYTSLLNSNRLILLHEFVYQYVCAHAGSRVSENIILFYLNLYAYDIEISVVEISPYILFQPEFYKKNIKSYRKDEKTNINDGSSSGVMNNV